MAALSVLVALASLSLCYLCLLVPGLEAVPDGEKLGALGAVRLFVLYGSIVPLNIGIGCWGESMISRARLRDKIRRKLMEDVMLS